MTGRFTALRTGPKLAKRLASVEVGSLPDEAVLDYLHAEVRQLAAQQARVWAAMAEVERRVAGAYAHDSAWTPERVFDCAAYEVLAELRVSKPHATHELEHATDVEAMPAVAAALRAGEIDRNRVLVLLDVCAGLCDAHRDRVIAAVLPTAGMVPPAKLRAEAQRIAMALDPQWAERRYREAVRRRRVVRYVNQDGTVTVAAEDQDAAEALAAYARLTALAKAARRAGARASLDELRSAISMGLLGPRFTGMHESDIIAVLVTEFPKPVADQPDDDEPAGDHPAAHADDEPAELTIAEPATHDEQPSGEPVRDEPINELSLEEEYYEAELLADELLDQGFFDDEECTGQRYGQLLETALAMNRSHPRRPRTDQDPDPPPF